MSPAQPPEPSKSAERLQKVLARIGIGSRRQIEEMIREGRITINGRLAELGDRVDLETEAVKVDGRRVQPIRTARHYVLLNKPSGYMSTARDPEGRPTVLDLLPQRLRKGLFPVGRLDYMTEGLLILTNDGELAQHVAHPRYGCRKTYEVKVSGAPAEGSLQKIRRGMVIDGKRTTPVEVRHHGGHKGPRDSAENSWWTVILNEGRTRQIREMFSRIGHSVIRLKRVAIGPISDPGLVRGAFRELADWEVEQLRQKTARVKPREQTSPAKRSSKDNPKASNPKAGNPRAGKAKTGKAKAGGSKAKGGPAPKSRPKTGRPKTGKAASPKNRGPRKPKSSGRRSRSS